MAILRNGFAVALVLIQKSTVRVVTIPRIRAQSDGPLERSFGIGGASRAVVRSGQAVDGVRVARIELQGALVLLEGEVVFSSAAVDFSECYINRGQAIVQLLRFLTIGQ